MNEKILFKKDLFNILPSNYFCITAINIMVDPDGTLDALTSLGLTSPTPPKSKTSNTASKPSATISPCQELPSFGLDLSKVAKK